MVSAESFGDMRCFLSYPQTSLQSHESVSVQYGTMRHALEISFRRTIRVVSLSLNRQADART